MDFGRENRGGFLAQWRNCAHLGPSRLTQSSPEAYARTAPATRPYFGAGLDDPPEAFAREAHLHPVFELLPAPA